MQVGFKEKLSKSVCDCIKIQSKSRKKFELNAGLVVVSAHDFGSEIFSDQKMFDASANANSKELLIAKQKRLLMFVAQSDPANDQWIEGFVNENSYFKNQKLPQPFSSANMHTSGICANL